jgi:two-component sensor histidine kinase
MKEIHSSGDFSAIIRHADSMLLVTEFNSAKYYEILYMRSTAQYAMGDAEGALEGYQELLKWNQLSGNVLGVASSMESISACYESIGIYDLGLKWLQDAVSYSRDNKIEERLVHSLFRLGLHYSNSGEFTKAKELFEESLVLMEKHRSPTGYHNVISGLLTNYTREGKTQHPRAIELLNESIAICDEPDNLNFVRNVAMSIIDYYKAVRESAKALPYARRLVADARLDHDDNTLPVQYVLSQLHTVEAAAGLFSEAYNSLLTYHKVTLTIREQNQANSIANTAVSLDLHKHEVARLEAEKAMLLELQSKNSRTRVFLISALFGLLTIGAVTYAYRRTKLDRDVIQGQKEEIGRSLQEKEVLLREIHHRVKNNLQIVSSLLQSQADLVADPAVARLFEEGQQRILSMALIHQNLYQSEQIGDVLMPSYLTELTANIERSFSGSDKISLELKVDEESVDIDTAVPLGLILNELITNAYKYAFPNAGSGRIVVELKRLTDQLLLRVSDNGVGMPPNHEPGSGDSLGLSLVHGLVRQLGGSIEWSKGSGTSVAIQF